MNYLNTSDNVCKIFHLGIAEGTRRVTRTRGPSPRGTLGAEAGIAFADKQPPRGGFPERTGAGPAAGLPWLPKRWDPRPSPGPRVRKELKETALEIPGSGSTLGWNPPGLLLPAVPRSPFTCSGANAAALCSREAASGTRPTQDPPPAARSLGPGQFLPGWRCCWAHVASKLQVVDGDRGLVLSEDRAKHASSEEACEPASAPQGGVRGSGPSGQHPRDVLKISTRPVCM